MVKCLHTLKDEELNVQTQSKDKDPLLGVKGKLRTQKKFLTVQSNRIPNSRYGSCKE